MISFGSHSSCLPSGRCPAVWTAPRWSPVCWGPDSQGAWWRSGCARSAAPETRYGSKFTWGRVCVRCVCVRNQATHRTADLGSSPQQGVVGGEALTRLSYRGHGGHLAEGGEGRCHRTGAAGVEVQLWGGWRQSALHRQKKYEQSENQPLFWKLGKRWWSWQRESAFILKTRKREQKGFCVIKVNVLDLEFGHSVGGVVVQGQRRAVRAVEDPWRTVDHTHLW